MEYTQVMHPKFVEITTDPVKVNSVFISRRDSVRLQFGACAVVTLTPCEGLLFAFLK